MATVGAGARPPEPLVKICGLTRAEDVALACELGAWAVGFIFAASPRRVTPAAARELVQVARTAGAARPAAEAVPVADAVPAAEAVPAAKGATLTQPLIVGVFVDASAGEIAKVVQEAGLDVVQLHGTSGPDGHAVRAAVGTGQVAPLVIQAVPVPAAPEDEVDLRALREAVAAARAHADIVLLDTQAANRFGGTGRGFPWAVARGLAEGGALLVGGGIGPENAPTALRLSGAWGVDVSSGVEASPGLKDHARLRALFDAVRTVVPGAWALLPGCGAGAEASAAWMGVGDASSRPGAGKAPWVWPRAGGPPGAGTGTAC